ncbi:MAG: hypothetical protein F6J93_38520 [Oscillatoria sp. SIO1A7]|nr:hypothetical protein [Oscillatoria sp. SIO1A7]
MVAPFAKRLRKENRSLSLRNFRTSGLGDLGTWRQVSQCPMPMPNFIPRQVVGVAHPPGLRDPMPNARMAPMPNAPCPIPYSQFPKLTLLFHLHHRHSR